MFREMRRKNQKLAQEECEELLDRATSGVLALNGDDGYPYAVPLSFVYNNGKIYFHSAKSGYKVDAVRKNPKASFCIICSDEIVPEEYTTYFKSIIVFGEIRHLEDAEEKRRAIEMLALKYAPYDSEENREAAIEREWAPLCMMEMTVEHISGKEAIELTRKRKINGR